MTPVAAVLKSTRKLALALAVLSSPALAQTARAPVAPAAPAFAATAVQTMPDGSIQTGRIMKAGDNMRIELEAGDRSSIQIMRGAEGVAYLVDPASKTYAEIRDPSVAQAVAGASTPCPLPAEMQAAQMTCKPVGEGKVSGITTQSWEITTANVQGAMRVEWDAGRRRALSQIWPDGTAMTMTFQAMQEFEGRQVEYWATSLQRPGQPAAIGGWWFDPELLVVVREEMPGGIVRALKDIQVGPIDPAMFMPPEGFTRVEAQPAPATGGGQ